MITKNISGVVFEHPQNINEYTIKKWQEMYNIENMAADYIKRKNEDGYLLEWFRTFTGLSMDTIEDKLEWNALKDYINEIFPVATTTAIEETETNVFEIDGVEYHLPPMDKLNVGEVLYIKEVMRQNENNIAYGLPNVVAALYREKVNGERVKLDIGLEERIELFKNRVLIKDVIKKVNFFLRGLMS